MYRLLKDNSVSATIVLFIIAKYDILMYFYLPFYYRINVCKNN